jgi:cytochrome c oxidase subunit 3
MVMFMAAWAMLFAGLLFAYGVLRVRAVAWPPPDLPRLPLALPSVATGLLALSSLTLERARRAGGGLAPVLVMGGGFLVLQVIVWRSLILAGLRPPLGPYASVFFGLTAVHALHVLVGLAALGWLAARRPRRPFPLRLWALYWHMVGGLWLVIFGAVYLW